MPGVPLLDILQETSRLLRNNIDDTDDGDDDDGCGDDGGDKGDLLAPGHQEGSSVNRPSPPRPTPAQSRLREMVSKKNFGNTWEVLKWDSLGIRLSETGKVGMGGQ